MASVADSGTRRRRAGLALPGNAVGMLSALGLVLASFSVCLGSTPVQKPDRTSPTLTICRDVSGARGDYVWLASTSTANDGGPVAGRDVRFKVKKGGHWEDLGVSRTSNRGAALMKYKIPGRVSTPAQEKRVLPFTAELLPTPLLRASRGSGLIRIVPSGTRLTPQTR